MKFRHLFNLVGQRTRFEFLRDPPSQASTVDASVIHNAISAAEQGRVRELYALYRDCLLSSGHLQSEFGKRKLAVLNEPMLSIPFDKTNPHDQAAAVTVGRLFDDISDDFIRANAHLMDSALYPVSVVEKVFAVRSDGMIVIKRLVPVPHTLLDYQSGSLKILDGSDPENLSKAFSPTPDRYIIHRGNLLTLSDCWGGPMRSLLFWWLLSTCDRTWWAKFLEKYGTPFLIGRYDSADDASRTILERAFSFATRLGGLVVTRETEIDLKQASASDSGTAFETFHSLCDREMSKIVIGQTLSADAQPTGLGSGVASSHETVRADIRRFDALALSTTIRNQLLFQLHGYNHLPGRPPKCQFGTIQNLSQASAMASSLASLRTAGIEADDSGVSDLSDVFGIQLRRAAPTQSPVTPFSVDSRVLDTPALNLSADLSQAFSGRHAEIARIIRESMSPDDCLQRLREFTASMRPGLATDLIQQALTAYAARS